jgi:tetratricopeptide (TPR) repeat protein
VEISCKCLIFRKNDLLTPKFKVMEILKLQVPDKIKSKFCCIIMQLPAFIFMFLLLGSTDLSAQFAEESVEVAYELRMKGETRYARAMLQKLLDRDQEDGIANYEFARLKMAQMMGGSDVQIESIINSARKAVNADSGNVAYAYTEASARFSQAYVAIMQEAENAKQNVDEAVACFERVVELKPDYHEARMQLVEFYFALPGDIGGDKEKAVEHARELEKMDWFFAAQAGEILRPEETSRIDYWQQVLEDRPGEMRVKKQLGLAYLEQGNLEEARPLFEEVVRSDPSSSALILDIARHHMYKVMRDRSKAEVELPLAEAALKEYLSLEPEPIAPLKAWTLSNLARIKFFSGQEEEGKQLMAKAKEMDLFFSRASDVPGMEIYIPPGEIYRSGEYSSFLRPF